MTEYKLPRKTLWLWRIRAVAAAALLLGICIYFYFSPTFIYILSISLAVLLIYLCFFYLPRFFKGCKIIFLNGAVVVEWGVFIKSSHILPFSRLIYSQTFTTPVAKLLGLTALSLKAARKSIIIPEMLTEDVLKLIAEITQEVS